MFSRFAKRDGVTFFQGVAATEPSDRIKKPRKACVALAMKCKRNPKLLRVCRALAVIQAYQLWTRFQEAKERVGRDKAIQEVLRMFRRGYA